MIGLCFSLVSEFSDGIVFNEVFSYEIDVMGNIFMVKILCEGKFMFIEDVDMSNSGYDVVDDYMYFKVGVYN